MRLPHLLLAATVLAFCTTLCFAADEQRVETAGSVPAVPMRGLDEAAIVPQIFIPPHGMQRGQFPAYPHGPELSDSLCYNIHSIVVAEDDHTGVTHPVRESTCTRASRFKTKDAQGSADK